MSEATAILLHLHPCDWPLEEKGPSADPATRVVMH